MLFGGFAVTFMKACKFNRLQIFGGDAVGGKLAFTLPERPRKLHEEEKFAKRATQKYRDAGQKSVGSDPILSYIYRVLYIYWICSSLPPDS